MKFSAAIVGLSFLYGASAFAPNSRVGISTTAPAALNNGFAQIGSRTATDASSTELGLFFMNTMKRRSEAKKAGNANTGDAITEKEVRALFDLWNSALATGDSRIVANRYAKNPVLLPTVSDEPRTDFDSVKDYFDSFLLKKPQGKILDGQIHIGDGWASDMGIYEFTMGATGDKVKARYTYNYIKEDGVWKIQHHHSSVLPEEVALGKAITEDEVRGLFSLWNNALATLDPKKVASRYAKKGVLLPTVSDIPRTDFTSIEDYFVNFLKLKPQGEILESHVTIGKNWCQDAGIYEFTMGATGKKVKGRYSFVYVYEDGEWKISHHHSSVMPEATMPKAISEEEVRGLFQLWNGALATLDPDAVARRYSKNAVLLPTVSDVPRTDYGLIKDYFVGFLTKKPQGEILESNVIVGHNWCQDAGIYEFTMGATGDKVKGRYTFVYVYEDGEWKIAHHHSSVMPEAFLGPSPKPDIKDTMSEQEVAGLFELWNSALATGDSHIVASRYAKKPILLATVSDEPRTDYSSIKNYFDSFLLKKPQGKIIDRKIHVGKGWATDMGIYEFTMGATGDKVKARYTFNYIREGGEWKIQHHHSSVMPEGIDMGKAIKEDEVRGLFSLWNNALATLDPKKVASRYAKKGVLLPTVSDIPRTDSSSIEDYFVNFLKLKPQGEILESHVTIGQNWCQDAGIYEFTMGATGKKVKGRYSFVYVYEDGEWKISHHHSSVMPEGLAPKAISEEEVRNLFQLWNGALATLDPDAVARRYSKNAVLLPTVSDVPRTSYDLIQDYFVGFLTKKPQGEILESNVTIGHNWCQDAGIYEFTMGATGDKVKGRYSFVYVYEDGEWKIAHHHSSVMPEAILGPSPKPAVVEEEELVMA